MNDGPVDKRRWLYDTKPSEDERRKEEVDAMARGKRMTVSNAHRSDCEGPCCRPGEWMKE